MPTSSSESFRRPDDRWVVEFDYEFEFDEERVRSDEDAEAFGRSYIDEVVRGAVVAVLRDPSPIGRALNVVVASEADYWHGSLKTRGTARILAELRDVPVVADVLNHTEWFWSQLQIMLGTKLGREVVLRNKRGQVQGAYPMTPPHLSPGARQRLLARGFPIPPNRNAATFTWRDQVGAAVKIAVVVLLLATPYACDYLDRRAEDARWREHMSHPVDVRLVLPQLPSAPTTTNAPQHTVAPPAPRRAARATRCPPGTTRIAVTSHSGYGFRSRVFCPPT